MSTTILTLGVSCAPATKEDTVVPHVVESIAPTTFVHEYNGQLAASAFSRKLFKAIEYYFSPEPDASICTMLRTVE